MFLVFLVLCFWVLFLFFLLVLVWLLFLFLVVGLFLLLFLVLLFVFLLVLLLLLFFFLLLLLLLLLCVCVCGGGGGGAAAAAAALLIAIVSTVVLRMLNSCRRYLEVVSLSLMSNLGNRELLKSSLNLLFKILIYDKRDIIVGPNYFFPGTIVLYCTR